MKKSLVTMMAALMGVAYAGETTTAITTSQDFNRLSGAVHLGAGTAYTCHGYVPSRVAVQGEGCGMAALQLGYDFGKESAWSYTGALSYKAPMSGHTLYGNPAIQIAPGREIHPIGYKNIENEFLVRNGAKYTQQKWNVTLGHDFIQGGIAGVVAKHFNHRDHSRMQQVFTNFEVTPVAWFSADINCARAFDTMDGWWFEAHARLKAPIVGSPDDIKVAGIFEYGMSWTANFYESKHNACSNGTQAFWLKLSTPWFVNEAKNFILTPSVSVNWLGKGGMKANERSHARALGDKYVPFRNFAVVGDLTASYKF
ncbi:MAG: hypothetical protein IKW48_09865 [Akkermansia sp.]|nr:hypothetical protein [Akkermansia sp.]